MDRLTSSNPTRWRPRRLLIDSFIRRVSTKNSNAVKYLRQSAGDFGPPSTDGGEVDFSSTISDSSMDSATETDSREAMLRQELESVDFYISQGYLDIAVDTLDMLEKAIPGTPGDRSERRQLNALSQEAPAKANFVDENPRQRNLSRPRCSWIRSLLCRSEAPVQAVPESFSRPAPSFCFCFCSGHAFDSGLADVSKSFAWLRKG